MRERPYVLLSVAMSVDGCIDDRSGARLVLSDAADLDRVDAERAGVDAVLVGATTVRRDDPRLLVRSAERVAERVAAGRIGQPWRVVISGSGELDPAARLFTTGDGHRIVYTSHPGRVVVPADVVHAGAPVDPVRVLADLASRGVERVMVEGGTAVHTLFLAAGLVDEIQLVVAPFFVGDPDAPRFVGAGVLPGSMRLAEARPMGHHVLLRYLLGEPRG